MTVTSAVDCRSGADWRLPRPRTEFLHANETGSRASRSPCFASCSLSRAQSADFDTSCLNVQDRAGDDDGLGVGCECLERS